MTYLARYLRGGPLKTARLGAWAGAYVTCTYRAHGAESASGAPLRQRMTLPGADVLQRWRRPVPGPQTRVGRSSGLYHHAHPEALAHCRAVLGQPPGEPPTALDWQPVCAQRGDAHPEQGPTGGQLLVGTGVIPRGGAPPPILARECAA